MPAHFPKKRGLCELCYKFKNRYTPLITAHTNIKPLHHHTKSITYYIVTHFISFHFTIKLSLPKRKHQKKKQFYSPYLITPNIINIVAVPLLISFLKSEPSFLTLPATGGFKITPPPLYASQNPTLTPTSHKGAIGVAVCVCVYASKYPRRKLNPHLSTNQP